MRSLTATVVSILLAMTGCGFGEDDNKGSADNVIFSITYDPADFYSFLDICTAEMRGGGKKTTYNHKDEIIRERVCAADTTAKILKKTERRKSIDQLKESTYSESQLNDASRIISYTEWEDSTKTKLTQEVTYTYSAEGKLTTSLNKSNDGKDTVTTTYDSDEAPASETTVSTSGTTTSTTTSTCLGTLFFAYKPCEKTSNDKLVEKLTKEGEEYVRTELLNDAMVETERFTLLPGALGHYAKYHSKSFSLASGELDYEEISECVQDGKKLNCTEKHKKASGMEYYTYTSTYENQGRVKITVGNIATEYAAYVETAGSFTVLKQDSELIGSMTSSVDSATLGIETKISLQKKTASHPEFNTYFYSIPYWSETNSSIDEIFADTVTDATVTFTSVAINDNQKRELSAETKDLTGLTPEQIDPDFVWKEVSTY